MLARRGWRLVYGAGDVGLMGRVARATQDANGKTFGVIPTHLLDWEVGKRDLDTFIITETMHERKKVMLMNADAVVVLPGGAGSLDELFEAITWRQLGLHSKPIFVLNISGFWTPLMGLIDHFIAAGFADDSLRGFVQVVDENNINGLAVIGPDAARIAWVAKSLLLPTPVPANMIQSTANGAKITTSAVTDTTGPNAMRFLINP